ncbi:DNA-processing protein DprA [Leifsonia sp. AG29]|uniref:DNA-processing protein DprA n=1 Tax=Leifsonia sp. AG29 TaxID=2598860 RepID=UPI001E4918F0|nr:DNA-processing protein DprA [Leifsonia sp. AG29]
MSGAFLGVPHDEMRRALARVTAPTDPEPGSDDAVLDVFSDAHQEEIEEVFARVALATCVEPGDADAGGLVAAVGARTALQALVEGWDPERTLRSGDEPSHGRGRARLDAALARWRPRLTSGAPFRALESAAALGASLLHPASRHWPDRLSSLGPGGPLLLWVRGDARRLVGLERSLSVVGARAATGYGEHVALESAAALSDLGFAIVSGGAYGIDGCAHRATLASGGVTVAVLAGGVDRLYPAGHSELLRRIADEGVLLAESPCGSTPTRWRFLMRNRIIAALSGATVVIEAGARSGSLNTAGHAAELGRPLGAVPGAITSPSSAGCHRLIREYAAVCVTTPQEMAELAGPVGSLPPENPPDDGAASSSEASGYEFGSPQHRVLLELTTRRPRTADELVARTGLPFAVVASTLGRLDADGQAVEGSRGWVLPARARTA